MSESHNSRSASEMDAAGGNGNGEAPATPAEIKDRLLRTGAREDGSGNETVLPDEEIQGAEHLQAAEGAMTFHGLSSGDADQWMDEQLSSMAKVYKTGPSRPQRSPIVRRVLGS